MGIPSQMGAARSAAKNNERLSFALNALDNRAFLKLYQGYRRALWSQLALPILLAVVVVLELIFIPSQPVPNGHADFKTTLIVFEAVFFIVPGLPLWLVVCNFTFGRLWRKYCKWYERGGSREELYGLLK